MASKSSRAGPTMDDVANAAGVSIAAASFALRGRPGVSSETRARVHAAAAALGYERGSRAETRHRRKRTVVLMVRARQGTLPTANDYYAPIIAGVEEGCRVHRLDLMLTAVPVDARSRLTAIPPVVTQAGHDGLIVMGAHINLEAAEMLNIGRPVVLLDAFAEGDAFDAVVPDNAGGARMAVEHLVSRGHRDIALVATDERCFPGLVARRRAYEKAVASAGLAAHYVDVAYRPEVELVGATLRFLKTHPQVSALFCTDDFVALVLMRAIQAAGIAIPDRLSVVGFNDIGLAALGAPPLTTVAIDKVGMGRMAVSLLSDRLPVPDGAVSRTIVNTFLVERASTGPPCPAPAQVRRG